LKKAERVDTLYEVGTADEYLPPVKRGFLFADRFAVFDRGSTEGFLT